MSHFIALGTMWSLLVATISVAFAVLSHRRQVNASVYLDLSRQLHELYKRVPKKNIVGNSTAYPTAEAVEALVFDSLQLIRTAFTLWKAGYFSGRLSTTLREDAEKSLRKPAFRELWPVMRDEFVNDPEFCAYVDRVQG